jgi:hypothetical protein
MEVCHDVTRVVSRNDDTGWYWVEFSDERQPEYVEEAKIPRALLDAFRATMAPEPQPVLGPGEFVIEALRDCRLDGSRKLYLVKWKGTCAFRVLLVGWSFAEAAFQVTRRPKARGNPRKTLPRTWLPTLRPSVQRQQRQQRRQRRRKRRQLRQSLLRPPRLLRVQLERELELALALPLVRVRVPAPRNPLPGHLQPHPYLCPCP